MIICSSYLGLHLIRFKQSPGIYISRLSSFLRSWSVYYQSSRPSLFQACISLLSFLLETETSLLKTILCSSILFYCNIIMRHQNLYLSSLILAALVSATPTPINPRAATPTSFKIQYQDTDTDAGAPALNGFANLTTGSEYDNYAQALSYTDDAAFAATFTLNTDGSLSVGDLISDMPPRAGYSEVIFQTQETIASLGDYKTYCTLGDDDILSCSTITGTTTGSNDNDVYYACAVTTEPYIEAGPTGRSFDDCYTLRLLAVPL